MVLDAQELEALELDALVLVLEAGSRTDQMQSNLQMLHNTVEDITGTASWENCYRCLVRNIVDEGLKLKKS